jgi:hypothetical protein
VVRTASDPAIAVLHGPGPCAARNRQRASREVASRRIGSREQRWTSASHCRVAWRNVGCRAARSFYRCADCGLRTIGVSTAEGLQQTARLPSRQRQRGLSHSRPGCRARAVDFRPGVPATGFAHKVPSFPRMRESRVVKPLDSRCAGMTEDGTVLCVQSPCDSLSQSGG